MEPRWEQFADDVHRIAVSGGHLYRTGAWVELPSGSAEPNRGYYHWSDPVFVSSAVVSTAQLDATIEELTRLQRSYVDAPLADRQLAKAVLDIAVMMRGQGGV